MFERFPIPAGVRRFYRDTWHADRPGRPGGHEGVDIAAPSGTPIEAVRAGRVVKVETNAESRCGLGVFIRVRLPNGGFELDGYCHMRAVPVVREREWVDAGEVLGVVGATGNATSTDRRGVRHEHPHLHFQVESIPGRVRRNPFAELQAAERAQEASPEYQAARSAMVRRRGRRAVERELGAGWGMLLALGAFLYWRST